VRIALLQPSVDHRTSFTFGEFTRSGNLFFLFWKFIAWRMKDYEPLPSLNAGADRVSNVLVFHWDHRAIATQKRERALKRSTRVRARLSPQLPCDLRWGCDRHHTKPNSLIGQGGGKRRGHIAIFNVTGVTATAVSQNYGLVSGVLIMPTDLDVVTRRKREAQTDQTQTTVTVMSVCLIIYFGVLVLMLEVVGQHS
jgi:hypothetical protein